LSVSLRAAAPARQKGLRITGAKAPVSETPSKRSYGERHTRELDSEPERHLIREHQMVWITPWPTQTVVLIRRRVKRSNNSPAVTRIPGGGCGKGAARIALERVI